MPVRVQRKRTKDPRPHSTTRPCYQCGSNRSRQGQNGYCSPPCRFWSKVDTSGECWTWLGAPHNSKGYGRFNVNGTRWLAHRYAYTLLVGTFSDELEIDHLCKNTRCVNPSHLEPVTSEVHDTERTDQGAYNRAKTECIRGHRFTPENTRITKRGGRACRLCGSSGTGLKGTFNGRSKLTEESVREARRLRNSGMSVNDLTERFGVTRSVMSRALSGGTWSHV